MQVTFARVELSDIRARIAQHWEALPGPIDSFLEDHVQRSQHYMIGVAGAYGGFASIHAGHTITQFALEPAYQHFGQGMFRALKRLENVNAAFVPTCDEFYLSHAIDEFRQLSKQAYLFEAQRAAALPDAQRWSSRAANAADEDFVQRQAGEFFGDTSPRIEAGEIFLTQRDGAYVGFGILERSQFRGAAASIGMFTIERFRRSGVGTATIALLMEECSRLGLRPVAGCWYQNHASKRTLERAGMTSRTRLLRVEY